MPGIITTRLVLARRALKSLKKIFAFPVPSRLAVQPGPAAYRPALMTMRPLPSPGNTITTSAHDHQSGRSLTKPLTGIALLAIVAAMALPQLNTSIHTQRMASVKTHLADLRNAVDLYYHQHNKRYPGEYSAADGKTHFTRGQEARAAAAFIAQLTQYTNISGKTHHSRTDEYRFGPYLEADALPVNPFLSGRASHSVDIIFDPIRSDTILPPSGHTGWRFYLHTGRLVTNDRTMMPDGAYLAMR